MRFIVDAQLPPALARMLFSRGLDAEHVIDIGLNHADDSSIWHYALRHHCVIITKDQDFPHRLIQCVTAPSIVWLRIGNVSRRALLAWFEPLLPQVIEHLSTGNRLVEVR